MSLPHLVGKRSDCRRLCDRGVCAPVRSVIRPHGPNRGVGTGSSRAVLCLGGGEVALKVLWQVYRSAAGWAEFEAAKASRRGSQMRSEVTGTVQS